MEALSINPFEHQKVIPHSLYETFHQEAGLQETPASQASASSALKSALTKSSVQTLPTTHDDTTHQLGPGGDEYVPQELDDAGEQKVLPNGALRGGREYRCRTFLVPNRGEKLFMLATECAWAVGYRDSYLLFDKNPSLHEIITSQSEKDDLVIQNILPSYTSRQIAIVTARSIFRQFGSLVIARGRKVRDDYWETKARKQGFTEADLAEDKLPGSSKERETAAAAAAQNPSRLSGYQGGVYDRTAFRLYYRHHEAGMVARDPGLRASEISTVILTFWFEEEDEVRNQWRRIAEAIAEASVDRRPPHMNNSKTAVNPLDIQKAAVRANRDGPFVPGTISQAAALPE